MRNYVETEKCLFAGVFIFWAANVDNTKRPDVILQFITRPIRHRNVDPEAGCDVKVGLKPQSHERDRSRVKRDATSETVVGRRTELLNGFVWNISGRPVYNFPSGSGFIQSPAAQQCKKVSPAKRFNQGRLVCSIRDGRQVSVSPAYAHDPPSSAPPRYRFRSAAPIPETPYPSAVATSQRAPSADISR